MKFTLLSIAALVGVVSAAGTQGYKNLEMGHQIKANSKAARSLMAKAMKTGEQRRLEDNFDEAVVASHSVVFESCHNVTTWTDEGAKVRTVFYLKVTEMGFELVLTVGSFVFIDDWPR
jgi:hypothetical protein